MGLLSGELQYPSTAVATSDLSHRSVHWHAESGRMSSHGSSLGELHSALKHKSLGRGRLQDNKEISEPTGKIADSDIRYVRFHNAREGLPMQASQSPDPGCLHQCYRMNCCDIRQAATLP